MVENSNALPARQNLRVSQDEGAGFLRRLPGAGAIGDGGVDLFIEHDFFEVRALVFFVREECSSTKYKVIILVALACPTNFANDESFSVGNHDLVTTRE